MEDRALIEADIEAYLERHQRKELLRLVTVGSVDDGKSTLIGRLLYDGDGLYEDQLEAVRRASAARSDGELDLSLVTDGLKAEREQGITIDVAYRYFTTPRRKFIIADTPGHVQYTRNMATGASTADAAVILVDARLGVQQQSRRHATIASLLGIRCLGVCVNKMDLIDFDEARFRAIAAEMEAYAVRLGFQEIRVFPVSARAGDNVVHPSQRTPWWTGGPLLAWLETVPVPHPRPDEPFRLPVQTVLRPHLDYRGFAGSVARGTLRVGDRVVALPSGRSSRVIAIDRFEGSLQEAAAPLSVSVRLADEIDASRGDMLVREGELPRVTRRFEAMLVWFSEQPLDTARSYYLKHTTQVTRAVVERVAFELDLETLEPRPSDGVAMNDLARVTVCTHRPLFVDAYRESRALGAFILIDSLTNDTVAGGMVLDDEPEVAGAEPGGVHTAAQVSPREREARLGQRGAVILLHGPAGTGKTRLGRALERLLFDRGRVAVVVDPDDAASRVAPGAELPESVDELVRRLADAGLFAVVTYAAPSADERARLLRHVGEERVLQVALHPGGGALAAEALFVEEDAEPAAREVLRRMLERGLVS